MPAAFTNRKMKMACCFREIATAGNYCISTKTQIEELASRVSNPPSAHHAERDGYIEASPRQDVTVSSR